MEDLLYRAKPWAITLVWHNWPIMLYAALIVWAALRAYRRPSRPALLFLYGFIVLALAFEYQKHGLPEARITIDYLFSLQFNPGPRHVSHLILVDLTPVAIHLIGFAFLILSIVSSQGHGPAPRTGAWSLQGTPRQRLGAGR
jgi:hypothetical protein